MEKSPEVMATDEGPGAEESKLGMSSDSEVYVDPVIEKRALRKFDYYVLPVIGICMLMSALDRSNIGNARVMGFDADLKLVGTQFNTISIAFFPPYLVMEVPWTLAIHKYGVNRVIFIMTTGWGAVTLGTGFIHTYPQAIAMRILLGFFEAGMIAGLIMTISTIWPPSSHAKRIAVMYVTATISGAFGGLIAYAIQTMGHRSGLAPWRWLFIIEGIISCCVAVIVLLVMPLNAEKAWFLSAEEKETMRARKQRNAVYRGKKTLSWAAIRAALLDPALYLMAICLFSHSAATLGFSIFLPTIIRGMGYTNLEANYLTVPVYLVGTLTVVISSTISDKIKLRAIVMAVALLGPILGYAMIIGSASKAVGYAAMFLCSTGLFCFTALLMTWISGNLAPDEKRAFGLPLVASFGGIAGTLASYLYQTPQAPRFVQGNSISLGLEVVVLLCIGLLALLWRFRNSKKSKLIAEGVTDNSKYGDEALEFKYTF